MLTPVGTASKSKKIFKAGNLKMSGANLAFNSQYYKVQVRETQKFSEDYLEITRKNVAQLQAIK